MNTILGCNESHKKTIMYKFKSLVSVQNRKTQNYMKSYTYLQKSFSFGISESASFPSAFCLEITSTPTHAK